MGIDNTTTANTKLTNTQIELKLPAKLTRQALLEWKKELEVQSAERIRQALPQWKKQLEIQLLRNAEEKRCLIQQRDVLSHDTTEVTLHEEFVSWTIEWFELFKQTEHTFKYKTNTPIPIKVQCNSSTGSFIHEKTEALSCLNGICEIKFVSFFGYQREANIKIIAPYHLLEKTQENIALLDRKISLCNEFETVQKETLAYCEKIEKQLSSHSKENSVNSSIPLFFNKTVSEASSPAPSSPKTPRS